MNLMPKISTKMEQSIVLKEYIDKYEKMEIQFLGEHLGSTEIRLEEVVDKYVTEFCVQEITIHPPLERFNIEYLLLRDENYVDNLVDRAIILSRKYNIKINLLFHTDWNVEELIFGVASRIKNTLKKIENEEVLILLENLVLNYDREKCSPLEFCEYINHPKLKMCLDICHLQAKANLFKKNIMDFTKDFLDKGKSQRQIYQIHFSYVANNDGYADKTTHGIVHPSKEELLKDIKILKEYGISDKIIVTEISEKDYFTRKDQIRELNWLEEVL